MLAMLVVVLGVTITVILHFTTGTPITTMVGILSGAVTNTPGLGAAQQANSDLNGIDAPEIALGYAVSYPLGVVGIILSLLALKYPPSHQYCSRRKRSGSRSGTSPGTYRTSYLH